MALLPFLPLLAAGFACLGTDADAGTNAMASVQWADTIGPVHAVVAALFLIATLKLARGTYRR
ncbi:hypothetical protein [Sphingomonas quercus]|uniref:Uncharacterized protein n=1 Tax=Sphingomonas quercus TaxID=2842451 RepID=A0ABS6BIR2_9SPHN|nr:hypothetical protein [Sphingomonas quercus]MBU3078194.1 hypothetical protein [Sphingomonas quercus]